MKNLRKILSLVLAVVLMLSMTTLVFASEAELQSSCPHDFVLYEVRRCEKYDEDWCYRYTDIYEKCQLCGYTSYMYLDDEPELIPHYVEDGSTYCFQCKSYGCNPG